MVDNGEANPTATTTATAKPAVATPPAAKPAAKSTAGEAAPPDRMRRRLIWTAVGGYLGVNLLMFLRFFFPRALYEPNTVFSIGYPADFALGIDLRFQQTNRVWVIREPDRIFAIFSRCSHLGCTPEWKASENKFKCPCHGSGYDPEGINFEGPAPRPMDRAHVELDPEGQILVDLSHVYKWPKGEPSQFNDPGAIIRG